MIYNEQDTREMMISGINRVSDVVGVTLGPARNAVIIDRPDDLPPLIINDGVTIARNISLPNDEMVGAKLLIEVCQRAQTKAGDGTTTASVLASALIKEGLKYASTRPYSNTQVREILEQAMNDALDNLDEMSRPVTMENIKHIARISANNDENMASMIDEAIKNIGFGGLITLEPSHTGKDEIEIVRGFETEAGYVHQVLEKVSGKLLEMENPLVVVSDQTVNDFEELLPALEISKEQNRPVVIVCRNVAPTALNAFVVNAMSGKIDATLVKAEDISFWTSAKLGDLAAYTQAHYFRKGLNESISDVKLEYMGSADKVEVTNTRASFFCSEVNDDRIQERLKTIQEDVFMSETEFHQKKHQSRISKLIGFAAIIRLHGESEQEIQNKKDRLDDALNAVRAAINDGYVVGGGLALIDASKDMEGLYEAFKRAMFYPFEQLLTNCGETLVNRSFYLEQIRKGLAYNGLDNTWTEENWNTIIDPTGVVKSSLRSAVSVAGYVLTAKRLITREKHELDRRL